MIINSEANACKLPSGPSLHILSYLGPKDVLSFRCTCHANNKLYLSKKEIIDFQFFKQKIGADPYFQWYVYKNVKNDPELKEAIVAFARDGIIKTAFSGYPILQVQKCMGLYQRFVNLKKDINIGMSRKEIPVNEWFDILKIINEKVYVLFQDVGPGMIDMQTGKINYFEDSFLFNVHKFVKSENLLYGGYNGVVKSWDLANQKCRQLFEVKVKIFSMLLDNDLLFTGCAFGKIKVYNTTTGKELVDFDADDNQNKIIGLKKYNNHIVSCSINNVSFFEFKSNQLSLVKKVNCLIRMPSSIGNLNKLEPFQWKFIFSAVANDSNRIIINDITTVDNIKIFSEIALRNVVNEEIYIKLINGVLFTLNSFDHSLNMVLNAWEINKIDNTHPPKAIKRCKCSIKPQGVHKFRPEWIFAEKSIKFFDGRIVHARNNTDSKLYKLVIYTPTDK